MTDTRVRVKCAGKKWQLREGMARKDMRGADGDACLLGEQANKS